MVTQLLKQVPLRRGLILPFVLQIVLGVGLTGYPCDRKSQPAIAQLLDPLKHEVSDRLTEQLIQHLVLPHRITRLNAETLRNSQLDRAGPQALENYRIPTIPIFEGVSHIVPPVPSVLGIWMSDPVDCHLIYDDRLRRNLGAMNNPIAPIALPPPKQNVAIAEVPKQWVDEFDYPSIVSFIRQS